MLIFDVTMVQLLAAYLQIDTSHPTPDYEQAYTLLAQQAQRDGLTVQRIPLPSGREVLVLGVLGSDSTLSGLALNHHVDVVPGDRERAGFIVDGVMYGRGTQDMKGVGMVQYAALRACVYRYGQPRRTVYLLAVPDEELGGFTGTGQLVQTAAFAQLGIQYVLDEGRPSGCPNTLLIKVSERRPVQIRVTAQGTTAHGSDLQAHNAVHELMRCCQALLEQIPGHVTFMQAGQSDTYNVVPAQAQAIIDLRIPLSVTNQQIVQKLATVLANYHRISYQILASVPDYQLADQAQTELFDAVQASISMQGLQAQVYHAPEASDLRFYWTDGITGLGLTPFTVPANLHGNGECVPVTDLELGAQVVSAVIYNFCYAKGT